MSEKVELYLELCKSLDWIKKVTSPIVVDSYSSSSSNLTYLHSLYYAARRNASESDEIISTFFYTKDLEKNAS